MTSNIMDYTSADMTDVVSSNGLARETWPGEFHGALTRAAAEERLGASVVRDALNEGTVVPLWAGVVVPATRARDPLTRAAAALLRGGPHAVLSGRTAVALHGCSDVADPTVHITIPYDRDVRSAQGLAVHQAWVRESDVLELDGLRVHALEVALVEMLCAGSERIALAGLEQALRQLGSSAERLRAQVRERLTRRRDRRGTRRAARLLELASAEPAGSVLDRKWEWWQDGA